MLIHIHIFFREGETYKTYELDARGLSTVLLHVRSGLDIDKDIVVDGDAHGTGSHAQVPPTWKTGATLWWQHHPTSATDGCKKRRAPTQTPSSSSTFTPTTTPAATTEDENDTHMDTAPSKNDTNGDNNETKDKTNNP